MGIIPGNPVTFGYQTIKGRGACFKEEVVVVVVVDIVGTMISKADALRESSSSITASGRFARISCRASCADVGDKCSMPMM